MVTRGRRQKLVIWANGLRVGLWQLLPGGDDQLTYDPQWLASPQGRPLSLSLPFTLDHAPLRGMAVRAFFDNLLPDSDVIRRRLQSRFHTVDTAAFALLEAVGRDCVGATQLLPSGVEPSDIATIDARPLNDAQVAEHLRTLVTAPVLGQRDIQGDEFRISIAGAQEKTAFLWHDNQWCSPVGATPTTHIFKLPLGRVGNQQADMRTSVENEWLCSRILHHFGVPVADCRIACFEDQKVLIVERFDRRYDPQGFWLRLPQEDFCQATATPPGAKYEADGGPGLVDLAQILDKSERREDDLRTLLMAQLLFWLMAVTDGHAKNFSIFLLPDGRYQLTPLYDVLSVWPVVGNGPRDLDYHTLKLAMSVRGKNKHYRLRDIQRRHFNHMARLCGWGPDMESLIGRVLGQLPAVMKAVHDELPDDFPMDVFMAIQQGMQSSADTLQRMPSVLD